MIKVRIVKNWSKPDLFRQTPQKKGIWESIQFTLEEISECDYLIVLNYTRKKIKILVAPANIWCVLQEPPNEYFKTIHRGDKVYSRVFTQDYSLRGSRYVLSQPALPWHINRDYDFLLKELIPKKVSELSFITTDKADFIGHKKRLEFLQKIRNKVKFDLFGYGFNPVVDKWDALNPYKYSLIVENYSGPYYWSEKLADCFLSYTMPIYYGCTNITDYFPEESLIKIDINDPDVIKRIISITKSDLWEKRKEAIAYARDLVLNKYQFFPFMANEIYEWEEIKQNKKIKKEWVEIPNQDSAFERLKFTARRLLEL